MRLTEQAGANKRIFVAGHNGMVGSAIVRQIEEKRKGCEIVTRGRHELDLTNQAAVRQFFSEAQLDEVYLAAAKVGGIHANNTYPAEFIYENLMIQANVIDSAHRSGVQKLLNLGSSCIYPRLAEQPMTETSLLTGALEPTNEPYALAKIAGIKLCESYNRQYNRDYRSVMPTNLYGPNDNFHPDNSHVIPALLRRFHNAVETGESEVTVWGSGRPRREFLHVDDMASACIHVMDLTPEAYRSCTSPTVSHINVGTGTDHSIREVAEMIAQVTGFSGAVRFDPSMPDGAPRKLLDVSRLAALGWEAKIPLADGLREAYEWFVQHQNDCRG